MFYSRDVLRRLWQESQPILQFAICNLTSHRFASPFFNVILASTGLPPAALTTTL
jgi:hypothetical protein